MKQREKVWFNIQGLYCRKFAKETRSYEGTLKMDYDYLKKGKSFLMKRTGDISQFAGAKRYVLADGRAKGVEAVDIKTGTGFCFTILPDRGMDIAWTSYRGMPISYITKTGIVGPAYYEPGGLNWLRGFFAGMLTTCGLSNVGPSCRAEHRSLESEELGLHGRISYTPAENVCVQQKWEDGLFCMTVSGQMREGILHGEALYLTRTITAYLGQNKIHIHDVVTNENVRPQPLMILYHLNIGYPVLSANSRLLLNPEKTTQAVLGAETREDYDKLQEPDADFLERLYFHDVIADKDGDVNAAMINDERQLGVYFKYKKSHLPKLSEWKMLSEAEYVVGIEPGNCIPTGRAEHEKNGDLEYLAPGESKEIDLEIGLLTNENEINIYEKTIE